MRSSMASGGTSTIIMSLFQMRFLQFNKQRTNLQLALQIRRIPLSFIVQLKRYMKNVPRKLDNRILERKDQKKEREATGMNESCLKLTPPPVKELIFTKDDIWSSFAQTELREYSESTNKRYNLTP